MTTTETMDELTRRGQEAFNSVIQIWADSWRPFIGLPASDAKVPSAEEVVDKVYDFFAQTLATQREFTKRTLAVTRSATSNAAWATQDASKTAARETAASS